jgi:hypothetical protein
MEEWSASRLCRRFNPRQAAPGIHCIGGSVGLEPVWTLWQERHLLALLGIEACFLVVQPVTHSLYRLNYSGSRNSSLNGQFYL